LDKKRDGVPPTESFSRALFDHSANTPDDEISFLETMTSSSKAAKVVGNAPRLSDQDPRT
jgi:hypothetical protein